MSRSQLPRRLQSIDVFRALTMFLMIFVNDVDGVSNIPGWIKHAEASADMLGFADTIFPTFLFIVGLSVPFALNKRMQSGESKWKIAWHIMARSLALIVMGFFHVNLENYSEAALLPEPVFEILITVAFFLIWLNYKPDFNKTWQYVLQTTGIVILVVLAILYKGEKHHNIVGLHHQWWGILGLIGWAYLTCALVYLFTAGKFLAQVIALIIFLAYNIFTHAVDSDILSLIQDNIWFIGNGSEISLIMAGIVVSLFYIRNQSNEGSKFFLAMFLISLAFFVFGFSTRPIAGISKIYATPAWVGVCTGIAILVFILMIYLTDLKGKAQWFNIIKPAGTATLTCYLIPYILYSLFWLCHFHFPAILNEGIGGILRSFAVSFIVIWIAGALEKRHIKLKI